MPPRTPNVNQTVSVVERVQTNIVSYIMRFLLVAGGGGAGNSTQPWRSSGGGGGGEVIDDRFFPVAGTYTVNVGQGANNEADGTDSYIGTGIFRVLVVGAGGAGGSSSSNGTYSSRGGGGGGGGVRDLTNIWLPTSNTITIGAGGVAAEAGGTAGGRTSLGRIVAPGGGPGGGMNSSSGMIQAGFGSSGGGASARPTGGFPGRGAEIPGWGGRGGLGTDSSGGGGGGDASSGSSASGTTGGNGGVARDSDISGSTLSYGGGGGGGGGTGGTGGGGAGTAGGSGPAANQGGGGGGSMGNGVGQNGGAGIVIIRFPTGSITVTNSTGAVQTTSGGDTILTWTGDGTFAFNYNTINFRTARGGGRGGRQVDIYDTNTQTQAGGGKFTGGGGGSVYNDGGGAVSNTSGGPGFYNGGDGTNAGSSGSGSGGGGGGGAGANGSSGSSGGGGTNGNGGAGGNGVASNITGSSVTYGGGGGGGGNSSTGGTGGGGNGSAAGNGANGTDGLGGGGGGATGTDGTGGSGGDGVVIIRYNPSALAAEGFSLSQTGASVTTDGSDTILTWTSNGSFTLTALQAPAVSTTGFLRQSSSTANLSGNVTQVNVSSATRRGFVRDTSPIPDPGNVNPDNLGITVVNENGTFGTGPYTLLTSGLGSAVYYFRAFVKNFGGYAYGAQLSFNTVARLATVTTLVPTPSIGLVQANANTLDDGWQNITRRGFVRSTSFIAPPGNVNPNTLGLPITDQTGTWGVGPFSLTMSGLSADTSYHMRAFVQNASGFSYGEDVQFQTLNYLDLPARLITSGYKWLTSTLYALQQRQTVRPYTAIKIIDDSVIPRAQFPGTGTPWGNSQTATAPDGRVFSFGRSVDDDGTTPILVVKWADNLDAISGKWANTITLNTSGDNWNDTRNIFAISISDYYQGNYRICLFYFGGFVGSSADTNIVCQYSDNKGATWTKVTVAASSLPNNSNQNFSLAAMKPVWVRNQGMRMGCAYGRRISGTTFPNGAQGYEIVLKYGAALATTISWAPPAESYDWTIHSLASYYFKGFHHFIISGFRNTLDPAGPNSNYSLWVTGLPRGVFDGSLGNVTGSASDFQDWMTPVPLFPVGAAVSTNKNQLINPTASIINGMVNVIAQAVLVESVSATAQTQSSVQNVETHTSYFLFQSDDGVQFSYPSVLTQATAPLSVTNGNTYYGTAFSPGPNGNLDTMSVGGWGDAYHSYLKFDNLPSVSAANVEKVILNLYLQNPAGGENSDINVQRVTSAWSPATLTRTNLPTANATSRGQLPPINAGVARWISVDITSLVIEWLNGTSPNFGIRLNTTTAGDNGVASFSTINNANGKFAFLQFTMKGNTGMEYSEFDGEGYASIAPQGDYAYLQNQTKLNQLKLQNIVADVTEDVIGYQISETAGQPASTEVQIGNQNNQWVGDNPTKQGAAAIRKNSRVVILQGFYGSNGVPEVVPHNIFNIDDINVLTSVSRNDISIVGRDLYKKLKTTITKYTYQFRGPRLFSDIFDGTTFYLWKIISGDWYIGDYANSNDRNTLILNDAAGERKITFTYPSQAFTGDFSRIFWIGTVGGNDGEKTNFYAFYIDADNWLRISFDWDGTTVQITKCIGGAQTNITTNTPPFSWQDNGRYFGIYIRRSDYYKWEFMIDDPNGNSKGNVEDDYLVGSATSFYLGRVDMSADFRDNDDLQGKDFVFALGSTQPTRFRFFQFVQYNNPNTLGGVVRRIARFSAIFSFKLKYDWRELLFTNPFIYGLSYFIRNRVLRLGALGVAISGRTMGNGEITFKARLTAVDPTLDSGFSFIFRRSAGALGTASRYQFHTQAFGASAAAHVVAARFERYNEATSDQYVFYNSRWDVNTSTPSKTESAGTLRFDPYQWNDYRVVMIDGWFYAFVNNEFIAGWNDNTVGLNFLEDGYFGFSTDDNALLEVKDILAPDFWKPVESFSLNSGDDSESAIESLIRSLRAWMFADLLGRFKMTFLGSSSPSTYTYNEQLIEQRVNDSDKEYVAQVTVYGNGGIIATARNSQLLPGVIVREGVIVDYSITTQKDAQTRADNELINANQYRNQYSPRQLINVGAELFDVVTVVNTGNNTSDVDAPTRVYSQGFASGGGTNSISYSMNLDTGNL